MEYYDEVVARAEGIMEREQERQRLEESADNNAIQRDNELSMLASSSFNGMEGIESSQGIDVKMGGVAVRATVSMATVGIATAASKALCSVLGALDLVKYSIA